MKAKTIRVCACDEPWNHVGDTYFPPMGTEEFKRAENARREAAYRYPANPESCPAGKIITIAST